MNFLSSAVFVSSGVFALEYHGIVVSNDIRIENFLDISKTAGSKRTRFHVCLFLFQCTPDQTNKFGQKCIR